ncbi:MAG: RNA methyltransferase [Myxococcales bacterium]|nr:MAG: RNA methyltransferase [Myxococcales bacterium]
MKFFASCARGVEGALRDELKELNLPGVRADRGGVHFAGAWADGYRACYESRIAARVLTPLGTFEAPSADALYEGVAALDWTPWLSSRHTLAVAASCRSSALTHTQYIAQRTKDAIVDQLRQRHGERPDVDRDDPDVRVFVHLVNDEATVYLDLSGEPLHKRGWRLPGVDAPLKENLAAAILRLSGWDRRAPLIDPMCGSGTFIIEAALWAAGVPAGALRERFGFERWACYDETSREEMLEVRRRGADLTSGTHPFLLGSDIDDFAIAVARQSAQAAGVRVSFLRRPLGDTRPTKPAGMLITNPPYGERLAVSPGLVAEFANVARGLSRHRVVLLTSGEEWHRVLPFRPERELHLFNGDLPCQLRIYDIR